MKYMIELEDKGQDFTNLITDADGVVMATYPFQTSVWKGAVIPIDMLVIGEPCLIHHPPRIIFGFLKYKVVSIDKMEGEKWKK